MTNQNSLALPNKTEWSKTYPLSCSSGWAEQFKGHKGQVQNVNLLECCCIAKSIKHRRLITIILIKGLICFCIWLSPLRMTDTMSAGLA